VAWETEKTWVVGEELPFTTSQVNRAGERIRKAVGAGKLPTADDLALLDIYRSWHSPVLNTLQFQLSQALGALGDDLPVGTTSVGRPLKTRQAIIAKLVREKSRLSKMQTSLEHASLSLVLTTSSAFSTSHSITSLVHGRRSRTRARTATRSGTARST
jgi:hypothetical protein